MFWTRIRLGLPYDFLLIILVATFLDTLLRALADQPGPYQANEQEYQRQFEGPA